MKTIKNPKIKSFLKLDPLPYKINEQEVARNLLDDIKKTFNVDLTQIYTDQNLSDAGKLRKGKRELVLAVLNNLNKQTPANQKDHLFDIGGVAYLVDSIAEIEPNISFNPADLSTIMGLRGDKIKEYLVELSVRFEEMAKGGSIESLVTQMLAAGLIGISVPMGIAAGASLAGGATIAAAVGAGISSLGIGAVVVIAAIILALLLFFLFFDNPKKIFGMIINLTEENFVVSNWRKGVDGDSNLYMDSGEMLNFMEDQVSLASPKYQIKSAEFLDSEEDRIVFGGLYYANKKFGLYGAEGVMVFNSVETNLSFAQLFSVPYHADNGTNMALNPRTSNLKNLFDQLYESRRVSVQINNGDYTLISNINHPRGGVVGCISCIRKNGF